MVKGGSGNDLIYGGNDKTFDGGADGASVYLYGNEGHDTIFGKGMNGQDDEYIWGGSGDDKIYGAPGLDGVVKINGNEGDDLVYAGDDVEGTITVNLGKGNDQFNTIQSGADAMYTTYAELPDANMSLVKVFGGEGDDVINAMNAGVSSAGLYYGGQGNDIIRGPVENDGQMIFAG